MGCSGRWGCSRPSGDKVVTSGTSQEWGCSRLSGDKVVTSGTRQGGGAQRAHTHTPARASHSLLLPVGAARTDRSAPRCKRTRGTRWTRGGAGGVQSPRPTSRRPPARASPVACRTADPVTAWSGPGRSRLRRELCRITRCQAAALAGTVASGAPIVGDDMACPGLDRWPFPC